MNYSQQTNQTGKSRKMLRRVVVAAGVVVVNLGILGGVGMVGDLGGFDFHLPGVAVCEAQFAVYEPYVGVDVGPMLLEAADPFGQAPNLTLTSGAFTDVNNQGYAVGWAHFSDGRNLPFFFSPVDGGSVQFLGLVGTQEFYNNQTTCIPNTTTVTFQGGTAFTLSNIDGTNVTSPDSIIIAGELTGGDRINNFPTEAVYWTWNPAGSGGLGSWDAQIMVAGIGDGCWGSATDINDNLVIAAWAARDNIRPYRYDLLDPTCFFVGGERHTRQEDAVVYTQRNCMQDLRIYGINNSDTNNTGSYDIVGEEIIMTDEVNCTGTPYQHARNFGAGGPKDLNGITVNSSVAYSTNDFRHIVGYKGSDSINHYAQLWWNNGDNTWTSVAITGLTGNSEATDINNQNEIVGNDDSGIFYSLLATNGSVGPNKVVDLSGLVMFPRLNRATAQAWSAAAINDKGWIAGSYSPDGSGGTVLPMLFIPQDVNNNQVPDIREILWNEIVGGVNLDVNNNWLLDWAENDPNNSGIDNMRTGLHAPGLDGVATKAINIDNIQIIRQTGVTLERLDQATALPSVDPENISVMDLGYEIDVNCLLSTVNTCKQLLDKTEEWNGANGNTGFDTQREVIFTIRNPLNDTTNFDRFEPAGTVHRAELTASIRRFSYRWAHCIDFAQFGNESFSGAGEYYFVQGDLVGSTYTGKFSGITKKTDLIVATAAVLDWSEEQVEAARIGSALGGRPWRFIGPAQPVGNVNTGAPGDPNQVSNNTNPLLSLPDGAAYLIREENRMLNENRMYFDMHMHYLSVQQAQDGLNNLTSTGSGWGLDIPDGVVVLEFGPKGDENSPWWGNNFVEFDKYFSLDTPIPLLPWENFIKDIGGSFGAGWEFDQYGSVGDFSMAYLLGQIDNKGYAAVCYGPTIQGPDLKEKFAIAALRATQIPNGANSDYIGDPDKFTPIKGNYEIAAIPFQIPVLLFKPHLYQCDPNVVCPPCPTN